MSLEKMIKDLDNELIKEWQNYNDLHKELNQFKGKQLDKENEVPLVNELLKKIQLKFKDLSHVFYFVTSRHQQAIIAGHEFQSFINDIKASGGFELPEEEEKKVDNGN